MRNTHPMAAVLLAASAVASEAPATDTSIQTLPESEYVEAEKCIRKGRIHTTDILSRDRIVFRMVDGQHYLVQLPTPCPGLQRGAKVMYVSDDLRLCSKDYLRPVYELGLDEWQPGARCNMGAFEPITEEQFEALQAQYRPADAPGVLDMIFGRRK